MDLSSRSSGEPTSEFCRISDGGRKGDDRAVDRRDDAAVSLSNGLVLDAVEVGHELDLIKDHIFESFDPFLLVGREQVDLEHSWSADQDIAGVDVSGELRSANTNCDTLLAVAVIDMSQHLVGERKAESHKDDSALHCAMRSSGKRNLVFDFMEDFRDGKERDETLSSRSRGDDEDRLVLIDEVDESLLPRINDRHDILLLGANLVNSLGQQSFTVLKLKLNERTDSSKLQKVESTDVSVLVEAVGSKAPQQA